MLCWKGAKMEKIRLLQFPIANTKGGITHYALQNWKWMDKECFTCDFVTMSRVLDFEEELLTTGSKIYHIPCYAEEDREQFVKSFSEILAKGYDIVHLHTRHWKSFLVEELCKKYQVKKVIVHAHNTGIGVIDPQRRGYEQEIHEQVKKQFNEDMATDFWACSKLAADFLFGEQIAKEKIKIMPNAIDLEQFAFSAEIRNSYRRKYGLEDSFVIGHAGRFTYQKNHEFIINVFHKVRRKKKGAKLILLGDGELMPQVWEQVRNLNIEEDVLLLGKREDINNWYQVMDVFCLPSRFEGLPLVMVEAQAAGLPSIASMNISQEVEITNNSQRISLDEEEWVENILACEKRGRTDVREQLAEAGYSIKDQIHVIEKEYKMGIV